MFCREVSILCKLHHAHIINFVGACLDDPSVRTSLLWSGWVMRASVILREYRTPILAICNRHRICRRRLTIQFAARAKAAFGSYYQILDCVGRGEGHGLPASAAAARYPQRSELAQHPASRRREGGGSRFWRISISSIDGRREHDETAWSKFSFFTLVLPTDCTDDFFFTFRTCDGWLQKCSPNALDIARGRTCSAMRWSCGRYTRANCHSRI